MISGSAPQHFVYGFLSVRSGIFRSPDTVVPCLVRRILVPRRSLSFFGSRNAPTLRRVFRTTDRSLTSSSSLFPDRGRSVFPSQNSTDLRVRGLGLGSLRIRRTTRSANTPFPAASCVVFRAVYAVRLTNGPFASDCFSLVRSRPTSNAVRFLRPVRSVPMRTSSTRRRVVLAPVVGTKLCALEDLCADFRPTTLPYIFGRRFE